MAAVIEENAISNPAYLFDDRDILFFMRFKFKMVLSIVVISFQDWFLFCFWLDQVLIHSMRSRFLLILEYVQFREKIMY